MAKKIMLVDDSATMLASVKNNLEVSGFSVETASDGVDALSKLKGGSKPDLLITDINMPNMNGIELIQNVRGMPGMRFIPILVLTTESQQAKRDEAKKAWRNWLVSETRGWYRPVKNYQASFARILVEVK